jgi:excinuclease ABC subunit A
MGPEGGNRGGLVVAEGTPEDVADHPESHTGRFLKPLLEGRLRTPSGRAKKSAGRTATKKTAAKAVANNTAAKTATKTAATSGARKRALTR